MHSLKILAVLAAASALLIGCASGPTPYQPATSATSLGFGQTQIEKDRFRVSYTANTPEEAYNLALLRSAEIAKAEGYSHFLVVNGGQDVTGARRGVTPRLGVGVGAGGYRNRVGGSLGVGIPIGGSSGKVRQSLEIKLQRTVSQDPNHYAADEVIRNLTQPAQP